MNPVSACSIGNRDPPTFGASRAIITLFLVQQMESIMLVEAYF